MQRPPGLSARVFLPGDAALLVLTGLYYSAIAVSNGRANISRKTGRIPLGEHHKFLAFWLWVKSLNAILKG